MKKLVAITLSALMLLSMAACASTSDADKSTAIEPNPTPEATESVGGQPIEPAVDVAYTATSVESSQKSANDAKAETEKAETGTEAEGATADGLRPDFKRAMDAYEGFYAEYCEFMAEYYANPTDMGLLMQYSQLMQESLEMNDAFEQWNSENLTDEELKYYLEVNSRVLQMLAEVMA